MKQTFRSLSVATVLSAIAVTAAVPTASAAPAPEVEYAYYAPTPEVPQSVSPAGLRTYLSTEQTQFDLQSFPMYGSLIGDGGDVTTFSVMMQQSNDVSPQLPGLSYAVEGIMWNSGDGFRAGGVDGVPDVTLPFTMTQRPWSIRSQSLTLGTSPQFVDLRVVKGNVGQKGAVYEVTANVNAVPLPNTAPTPSTVYVRATDTLGMAQWGYGPSGFMPQWIYPHQRTRIVDKHAGSIDAYLRATGDPMKGQGGYYYTVPLLRVDTFSIYEGGKKTAAGSGGWLLMDNVNQSYGPKAAEIVKNDVTWLEFSTQLPEEGVALKIGRVHQDTVGALPYASIVDTSSDENPNGTLTTRKWPITAISIRPVPGHVWTSPVTGLTYNLKYRVVLGSQSPGGEPSELVYTAVFPEQEVAFPNGGRAVYEGLYRVTGTLEGKKVTGQAWGEVQPAGSLS